MDKFDDVDSIADSIDEESEEEQVPKQRKKRRANPFIEEEAAVDEDEDEDEYDEDDEVDKEEVEEIEKNYRDDARHRKYDQARQMETEVDAEEIAERFRQRYGGNRGAFRGDVDHVPQNVLIPGVLDPKLWLAGKERDIVLSLMKKHFIALKNNTYSGLLSAFARDGLSGYVYIEADKQASVTLAIEQTPHLYATKLQVVPIGEMVDCLTVRAKDVHVKLSAWVRVKRGKYGGDLGQVVEITDSGDTAIIKLIPRLESRQEAKMTDGKRKKSELKAPQKLFNQNDYPKREYQVTQHGFTFRSENFDRDGFLEKSIKKVALELENVNPSLEEITRFSGGSLSERDEMSALANANIASATDFQVGENVIIQSGELRNIPGVVQSVENGIVSLMPDKSSGLTGVFRYPARELAKRFSEGDHVRVINGAHKDETGLVLKIEDNIITILSDTSLDPIQVLSKDLRLAAEITSSTVTIGQYGLQDLVQLSPNEVGVVIKIEKDLLMILNQYGSINRVKPQQVRNKRDSTRAVTSDSNGKPVTSSDTVVVDDPASIGNKKRATVLHVYRSFLFLSSREVIENNGIFVAKSQSVSLLGGKGILAGSSNDKGMGRGEETPRGGFRSGFGGRKDELISKTVNICGGPFKGYLGIVKDATADSARVELHTNNRIITVEKSKIVVVGESKPRQEAAAFDAYQRRPTDSRTPMHNNSSRTPMHRTGGETPNPYADSGRTPAWEAGSRTPAWNAGSKTPAWDSGSRTPAHNPYTPSAYVTEDKSTPYNPNTPGFAAATPYNPTTPAALPQAYPNAPSHAAATPYAPNTPFIAATPAAHPEPARSESSGLRGWLLVDIEVKFVSRGSLMGRNGSLDEKHGVIESVDGKTCSIRVLSSNEVISHVSEDVLVPVPPERREPFKVVGPENFGASGSLLSIDGLDGVVRLEGRSEIIMMNMSMLARFVRK